MNDYTTGGKFFTTSGSVASQVANSPTTVAGYTLLVIRTQHTGRFLQIVIEPYYGTIYFRGRDDSNWGEWQEVATTSNLVHVEAGTVSFSNVEAGSYGDVNVTFDTAFEENPYIVISLSSSTTATGYGNVTFTTVNRSTTGFTARCLNGMGSTSTSPNAHWIATR